MGPAGHRQVAVTGVGVQTPLGASAGEVLARIARGETATDVPARFDASAFACKRCAEVPDFRLADHVGESKSIRMMSRDAQLAVAAARAAMQDAGLRLGEHCRPEDIALYVATGTASLAAADVTRLVRNAAAADGSLDLARFGAVALKRVRPVLSFKILSNMPLSFVSIAEGLRGPNAVYTPWEGQGAQAIAAGVRAIRRGEVNRALAGGCDVKTNEFAFLTLQQQGVFDSWRRAGEGPVPGEGAAFCLLEEEASARARGARVYGRISAFALAGLGPRADAAALRERLFAGLNGCAPQAAVLAADGDAGRERAEAEALRGLGVGEEVLAGAPRPKRHTGNLFAAAAALQVALAATVTAGAAGRRVWASCLGHGRQQAAFAVESA